jgi:hypothetical protein
MTFVDTIAAFSERVLRERTFALVVAPAIADLQYEAARAGLRARAANTLAVLRALLGGVCHDATNAADLATFAIITLIPAAYYTLLILVCAPRSEIFSTITAQVTVGTVVLVLSLAPAVACYWPEPRRRHPDADV